MADDRTPAVLVLLKIHLTSGVAEIVAQYSEKSLFEQFIENSAVESEAYRSNTRKLVGPINSRLFPIQALVDSAAHMPGHLVNHIIYIINDVYHGVSGLDSYLFDILDVIATDPRYQKCCIENVLPRLKPASSQNFNRRVATLTASLTVLAKTAVLQAANDKNDPCHLMQVLRTRDQQRFLDACREMSASGKPPEEVLASFVCGSCGILLPFQDTDQMNFTEGFRAVLVLCRAVVETGGDLSQFMPKSCPGCVWLNLALVATVLPRL